MLLSFVCRGLLSFVLAISLALPIPAIAYAVDEKRSEAAGTMDDSSPAEASTVLEPSLLEPSGALADDDGSDESTLMEVIPDLGSESQEDGVVAALEEAEMPSDGDVARSVAQEEPREDCVAGEVIVVFNDPSSSTARALNDDAASVLEGADVQVIEEIAPETEGSGAIVSAQAPDGMTVDDTIAELSDLPEVAYAQPNYSYRLIDGIEDVDDEAIPLAEDDCEAFSVDDPLCNNSLVPNGNQYYLYQSKTIDAWNSATSDGKVTVAVLDTGCRLDHVDLSGVIDAELAYDTYHDAPLSQLSSNGTVPRGDVMGHGTHVAGIIGAQANNGIGIAGASYNSTVLPVKVFNDGASSLSARASTSNIIKAYSYLANLINAGKVFNLRVINLSLGYYPSNSSSSDRAFEQAIASMRNEHGVLTVCAGGNGDANGNPLTDRSLPSDFEECLSVTSLDRDGGNTYWSDYNEYKDISAYGASITSTSHTDAEGYRTLSGSSMSSPLVGGVAALLWAANPDLSVDQVVSALEETADPVQDSENDRLLVSGSHGAVNAKAAVDSVLPASPVDPINQAGKARNLVLLVRFAGDEVGDGDTGFNEPYLNGARPEIRTNWEHMTHQFNEPDSSSYVGWGLRSYLAAVSEGQHDVVTDFPQTRSDGRVSYLTLDVASEDFGWNSDLDFLSKVINRFNETYDDYAGSRVDGDLDGYVDNVLIVVAGVPSDEQTPFHAHKANANDPSLKVGNGANARTIDAYNIIPTTQASLDWGVVAHEYLHTLGARDYYRSGANAGSPVGVWDIMASSGSRSRPLAITREQIGWTTIPEVTKAGTYKLEGNQAMAFRSPLGGSEYFVAEYRQKGSNVTGLDSKIGGSGLIVYRVNPAYVDEGNINGNDYAYVFRPNETGLGNAAGDLKDAQISASGSRQSIGSSDFSRGIIDGALCYANGANSGIVVEVVEQVDDSITFSLAYPDYESLDLWDSVQNLDASGSQIAPKARGVVLQSDGDNVYALVDEDGRTRTVLKYEGSGWTDLGVLSDYSYGCSLVIKSGVPYVIGIGDGGYTIILKEYRDGAWRTLATYEAGARVGSPSMAFVGEKLYVVNTEGEVGFEDVVVYEVAEGALSRVASVPAGTVTDMKAFELGDGLAVSYGDIYKDVSFVRWFKNNEWKELSKSEHAAYSVSVAHDGGKTYVYQGLRFPNGDVATPQIVVLDGLGNVERSVSLKGYEQSSPTGKIASSEGRLYLCMTTREGYVAKVYSSPASDLETWESLGSDVYSPAYATSMAIAGESVYVGFTDYGTHDALVKRHDVVKQEHPLTIEMMTPPDVVYGYARESEIAFSVENTGNVAVEQLVPLLDAGLDEYEVGAISNTVLAPGDSAVLTCKLKTGLNAGSYPGKIRISSKDSAVVAVFSFNCSVKPLSIAQGSLYEFGSSAQGVAEKTYTGKPQTLLDGWRVVVDGIEFGAGDIVLSYRNNVAAGNGMSGDVPTTIVSATSENLEGTFEVPFSIAKADISSAELFEIGSSLSGVAARTYTGESQTLASGWVVRLGDLEVGENDIDLTYLNNTNAASAFDPSAPTVIAKGHGSNVEGTFDVKFDIKPFELDRGRIYEAGASSEGIAARVYDGAGQTLSPGWTIRQNDIKLDDKDIVIEYSNNVNVGGGYSDNPPTVIASGKTSNVTGSFAQTFVIEPLDISSGKFYERGASSPGIVPRTYNGAAQTISDGWSLKASGLTFSSHEVKLTYRNNVNAAQSASKEAPVVVASANSQNLTGSLEVPFTINKVDISLGKLYEHGAVLPGVSDKDWSGKPCVLADGWEISAGGRRWLASDVALSYGNNVNAAGKGSSAAPTVTVSAVNQNLTGSFSVKYTIKRVSHWERIWGATAFETMESISRKSYPSGSNSVVVATFDGYWDALTASSLASFEEAPILLTKGTGLSDQARREIQRLKATRAIVVGGPAAVSNEVISQIENMGLSVSRQSGKTAMETAVQVYKAKIGQWSKTAIVATADGYWDALSIAPFSYSKKSPVFLAEVDSHALSDDTLAAIAAGDFENAIIVGGPAAVSTDVDRQLGSFGLEVKRLSGPTAASTSLAIAKYAISQGMTAKNAGVATIDGYWDALTGAALCGKYNSVLMLASEGDTSCMEGMISLSRNGAYLTSRKANLQHGFVFGGQAAVPNALIENFEMMYVGP